MGTEATTNWNRENPTDAGEFLVFTLTGTFCVAKFLPHSRMYGAAHWRTPNGDRVRGVAMWTNLPDKPAI